MVVAKSPAKPRRVSIALPLASLSLASVAARRRALIRASRFLLGERLPPNRPVGQPATVLRVARDALHPGIPRASFAYFPAPLAIGGRSASQFTVFLPTCSPPLSRNIARATAISAPRMAPSVPFRALWSLVINSDHSHLRQRPCRIEVPAGGCARAQLRQPCGVSPERLTVSADGTCAARAWGYVDECSAREIEAHQGCDRRVGGRDRPGGPCPGDLAL